MDPDGLGRLVAAFVDSRENPNTRAAYGRDLAALTAALGAPAPPADAAAFGIEDDPAARAAAAALAALPLDWWQRWRDGLPGRLATRRRRVAAVRAFCRWWSRALALENPVRDLRPPASGPEGQEALGREVVALAPAAVRRMCEAAAAPGPVGARDAALIEVLYGCGLRASEAAGLDLSACHLDDPDDPFVLVDGKGGRRRPVAVPRRALAALTAYLRTGRPELRARDRRPRPDQARHRDADAVFLSSRGRRLGRAAVWRIVTEVADRAGLRAEGARVFPHALRHSCGTHLIQSGVDIRYVQAHLGHASPVTTEVYTHVTAAHLREDFDRAHPRARARARPGGPPSAPP
ncbi:tyrosine-type recombinase/integrase [Miltoncostaea marina]|uniref:tyrosine-type recombinase/integrase n=1 Tax=Miltoncostaea marina TaxID=2843215 RepID=UPI001C3C58F7|nr:tyrosine-type recombinase/integrase [Miltoncostaea marina]